MNLINQNTVHKTAQHYNWITIVVPGSGIVVGALQEQVSYSVEANYSTILSVDSFFSSLNNVTTLAFNQSLFKGGYFTRRTWKGGGYLKINPKFRIVNHDGSGNVVADAINILNAALPKPAINRVTDNVGTTEAEKPDFQNYLFTGAASATTFAATALGGKMLKGSTPWKAATVGAGIVAVGVNLDKKDIASIVNGIVSNQPTPVQVGISNYFDKTFVLESASVTFSQEMIEGTDGSVSPMYADFECTFGTQEITTFGNTGLKNSGNRFKIE